MINGIIFDPWPYVSVNDNGKLKLLSQNYCDVISSSNSQLLLTLKEIFGLHHSDPV